MHIFILSDRISGEGGSGTLPRTQVRGKRIGLYQILFNGYSQAGSNADKCYAKA